MRDETGESVPGGDGRTARNHRTGCKPTWAYVFDVGRGANGKRKQKTKAGFRTRRDAQRAPTEALDSLGKGTYVDTGRLTVGRYLADWLDGKASIRDTTRRFYEGHLRLYLVPSLGHLRPTELRHAHVQQLFLELRRRDAPPLTPSSLRRVHATLNSALNDAVKLSLLAVNHAAHVELPAGGAERLDNG